MHIPSLHPSLLSLLTLSGTMLLAVPAFAQDWLNAPREILQHLNEKFRATADFDGDGRPDLLVTRDRVQSAGISELRILFGAAGGGFVQGAPILAFPQGYEGQEFVLAGDLTGDGQPDIVTSLREFSVAVGHGFLMYRNLGGGTFAAPVHTPSNMPIGPAVLSDWNGDGIQELVAPHYDGARGTLQRWTWQGTGFVGSNLVPMPEHVGNFAVGELTGDGLQDVVVSSFDRQVVYVLPTLPGGGLGTLVPYQFGTPNFVLGCAPACGDLDGDGDLDIVAGWSASQFVTALSVITNNGAGGLTVGPVQTFELMPGRYWRGRPHIADWDGDGDGDVLLCWEHLYLLEHRQPGVNLQVSGSTRMARSNSGAGMADDGSDGIGAVDLNGDGHLDFPSGRTVLYGNGLFKKGYFPAAISTMALPVDWDGDGDIDILESGGKLRLNQGRNEFREVQVFPPAPPGRIFTEAHACGDFNGDGQLDLLVTSFRQLFPIGLTFEGMHLLGRGPDGRLLDLGSVMPASVRVNDFTYLWFEHQDLDGDGDLDLAARGGWWENNGSGGFTTFHPAYVGLPVMAADVDGNGRSDLLTVTHDTQATTWRLARGQVGGGFVAEVLATGAGVAHLSARGMLVDLDGDGDLDFATGLGGVAGPGIVLRENQNGTFAAPITLQSRDRAFETLMVEDFDNDGAVDIAAFPATFSGYFGDAALVWRRTGPGLTYGTPRAYVSDPMHGTADLDGDGDPDVFGRHGVVRSGRFSGVSAGRFWQYGNSEPGPSGFAPVLGLRGPARAGATIELRLRHGEGGGLAVLALGLGPDQVPDLPLPGLTLRVSQIALVLPLTLQGPVGTPGTGFLHLPVAVPLGLNGFALYQQAFFVDGQGFAASNGLEVTYGG
jgi:hypothetical protein